MSTTEILLLGPHQVLHQGRLAHISSTKAVALLGFLVAHERPQSRERLMDLLWSDSLPQAARKNLRNLLWGLRRQIGSGTILTEGENVSLSDSIWSDVRTLRDAAAARTTLDSTELEAVITLYRGTFLQGLSVGDAPEFELWLAAEREALQDHYLQLLETNIDRSSQSGDWNGVADAARLALAQDGLREGMHRALMQAYARLGRRSEAIQQYEKLRATLESEMGMAPLPETMALYESIRHGELDSLATTPVTTGGSGKVGSTLPGDDRRTPAPFIGRQEELHRLDAMLANIASSGLRVALLTGEVGIGKSRLWQEWSARLGGGLAIVTANCLQATQTHPLAPIVAMLRRDPLADRLRLESSGISPVWLAELSRLMPELRQYHADLPMPIALQPAEERMRLYEAITQAMLACERPMLLLIIDDLHWADQATLDWLAYFVDHARQHSIMLVAAFRPDEAPAAETYLLADWHRQGLAERISLGPLGLEDTRRLLGDIGADVNRSEELLERSAGNPYFLIELSQVPSGSAPASLRQLLLARLTQLPPNAAKLLGAASVIDAGIEFDVLEAVAGLSTEETLETVELLLGHGLLQEEGSQLRFVHSFVAELLREELSVARRRLLHRRTAQVLEQVKADHLPRIAGELAEHYAEAGDPLRAADFAEMAADRALEWAAPDEAVGWFQKAMAWAPNLSRLMGLGEALRAQGDNVAAQELLLRAVEGYERKGDKEAMARACLALAASYMISGQREKVISWASRVLEDLDDQLDTRHLAYAHFWKGAGLLSSSPQFAGAEFHLNRATQLSARPDLTEISLQSRFELGNLLSMRGRLPEAIDCFAAVANDARLANIPVQQTLALNNQAYNEHLIGDLDAARKHMDAALQLDDQYAFLHMRQFLYSTSGEIALASGEFDQAEQWLNRSIEEASAVGNVVQIANATARLGQLAQLRGDLDTALVLIQEARRKLAGESDRFLQAKMALWQSDLHQARGEMAAAAEALDAAEAILSDSQYQGLIDRASSLRARLRLVSRSRD